MSSFIPQISYQSEQITHNCCFLNPTPQPNPNPSTPKSLHARSLPHKSKDKKINVMIAKRGNSHEKPVGISLSKNFGNATISHKLIRTQVYSNGTTLPSKDVSQKNSLVVSRMRPDQPLKIDRSCIPQGKQSFSSFPQRMN